MTAGDFVLVVPLHGHSGDPTDWQILKVLWSDDFGFLGEDVSPYGRSYHCIDYVVASAASESDLKSRLRKAQAIYDRHAKNYKEALQGCGEVHGAMRAEIATTLKLDKKSRALTWLSYR